MRRAPGASKRLMKLAMFMTGDGNYHMAGWRMPGATCDGGQNIRRWVDAARTLERGKLDMLFIADGPGVSGLDNLQTLSHVSRIDRMDPVTVLCALAMATERLGLVATISTSYTEPYNVARQVASLDHISGGRAGWNIVTSGNKDDAQNFNLETHTPHGDRYARAEEFVDVVRGLWDSYDDDAFPRDVAAGKYMNPDKVKLINHKGKHFRVRGPATTPRSPQGHPVLVQAGSSEAGMNLSARVADIVFTSQSQVKNAREFYDDVKSRCDNFGRSPDDMKVMPGVLIFSGDSEAEAREKFELLQSLIPLPVAMQRLSHNLGGVDLSGFDLDKPLPDIPVNSARVSAIESYLTISRRDGLTLRQMAMRAAAAKHHWTLIGSVKQVADALEEWFVEGAADGFNILAHSNPNGIDEFVDKIVPELRRRGLFRTEYEGHTLRENLGLSRPANRFFHSTAGEYASA